MRQLPRVVLATAVVTVAPAVAVAMVLPARGPLSWLASLLTTGAVALLAGRLGAAYWMRRPGSHDLVFADLMLWGWVRRLWAERRLVRARHALEAARAAGAAPRLADLERLGRLLEARDAHTHGHSQRVARHAERIARDLQLPREEVARIRTAAALHDIGKLHTPRAILTKPARLTDAEYAVIRRHPDDGAQMLAGVGDDQLVAIVRHHHERLDGSGYPDGLTGAEIPLGARIVAVADTFDAMTSSRPYCASTTHKRALDLLAAEAGTQLDADAVSAFTSYYSGRTAVLGTALAAVVPQRLLAWLGQTSQSLGAAGLALGQALPALGAAVLLGATPGIPSLSGPEQAPLAQLAPPSSNPAPAAAPTSERSGGEGDAAPQAQAAPEPGAVTPAPVPESPPAPGAPGAGTVPTAALPDRAVPEPTVPDQVPVVRLPAAPALPAPNPPDVARVTPTDVAPVTPTAALPVAAVPSAGVPAARSVEPAAVVAAVPTAP